MKFESYKKLLKRKLGDIKFGDDAIREALLEVLQLHPSKKTAYDFGVLTALEKRDCPEAYVVNPRWENSYFKGRAQEQTRLFREFLCVAWGSYTRGESKNKAAKILQITLKEFNRRYKMIEELKIQLPDFSVKFVIQPQKKIGADAEW